jgi:hypothetical protein
MRAIQLPCPCGIHPHKAAILGASAGTLIYLAWSVMLLRAHSSESCIPPTTSHAFCDGLLSSSLSSSQADPRCLRAGLSRIARLSSGISAVEINSITAYTNFSFYFVATMTVIFLGALCSSAFGQRDLLRNFSRFIWVRPFVCERRRRLWEGARG